MTDETPHATREDLPESDRQDATKAVPGHLALALRDYFDVAAQAPLPDRLGELLARFEAALASHAAFKLARPSEKLRFQYTTSSSELQRRLKVADEAKVA